MMRPKVDPNAQRDFKLLGKGPEAEDNVWFLGYLSWLKSKGEMIILILSIECLLSCYD